MGPPAISLSRFCAAVSNRAIGDTFTSAPPSRKLGRWDKGTIRLRSSWSSIAVPRTREAFVFIAPDPCFLSKTFRLNSCHCGSRVLPDSRCRESVLENCARLSSSRNTGFNLSATG
jgi:hypothetical protein